MDLSNATAEIKRLKPLINEAHENEEFDKIESLTKLMANAVNKERKALQTIREKLLDPGLETEELRGFRGGRWEGRDIKPRGSPDCPPGVKCLPMDPNEIAGIGR